MAWFGVPVRFEVKAPTTDAARLLAKDTADRIATLLDYADYRIETLTTPTAEGSGPLESFEVEVAVFLERDTADEARADVDQAVAELGDEGLKLGDASAIEDPRRPTKTTLEALGVAADMLLSEIDSDAQALRGSASYEDTDAVSYHLPRLFARHYTVELVERWRASVASVAEKLAAYPDTYLATTAEELAAHALLEEAKGWLEHPGDGSDADIEEAREKLEEMHDLAFEDHDVLMLFDSRFDGVEEGEIADAMGLVNLHPRDWFKPFRAGRL